MRLAVAAALAILAIVVLALLVERLDAGPKPTKRAKPVAPQDATEVVVDSATWEPVGDGDHDEHSRTASSVRLGFRLRPTSGTIMLVRRASALAPDIAPVVEILATGELVLRRPMPIATGPTVAAPCSQDGHGAGVVLPSADLESLNPAARAALIWLLRQWLLERPVSPGKLCSSDLKLSLAVVRRLLSWVP